MGYRYCKYFRELPFVVNGRIDMPGAPVVSLCCEMIQGMPRIVFQGPPERILQDFLGLGAALNAECRNIKADQERRFTAGCLGCVRFVETNEIPQYDGLIHHVNISSYPAPCQSHCFYCWVHDWDERFTSAAKNGYELMFSTLELAQHCGLIADDALWNVASGEIAIHPYHDRIVNLFRGKKSLFLTNCMKYDEAVAENLHENPESQINLSIDSGTRKTWAKVKGVDNFDQMIENLCRYYVASQSGAQITLKYIVFPGINDNYEDYLSLIQIMKTIDVNALDISRDGRVKYGADAEYHKNLMGATAYLVAICQKNGITTSMDMFSDTEQIEVMKLADEILQTGKI